MKKRELKVKGVMTPVVQTCRPEDSLERAAQLLWEYDCGCLPVTDGEGIARAMITDRDICMAAFSQGKPLSEMHVADSMSRELVACGPEEELTTAADLMAKYQVRRLPVVDEGGRVQGLLSVNDLACCSTEENPHINKNSVTAEMLHVLSAVSQHRELPWDQESNVPPAPLESSPQSKPSARSPGAEQTGQGKSTRGGLRHGSAR